MGRTKLYYVGSKGLNFGDSINPIVFERLFGFQIERAYPTYADVVGIGSILQMLTFKNIIKNKKFFYFYKYNPKPIITMGTGFMFDFEKTNLFTRTYRPIIPLVLRGKLTHSVLEKNNNKKYQNVEYGDLGLIFSHLLKKKSVKKYELGIVPHNIDYENKCISELLKLSSNSTLIHLGNDPLEVMKQISECETIISSSLHGLIAADSLNIPNKRIKLSNHGHFTNIDFKFDDYYSIFDAEIEPYVDFTQEMISEEQYNSLKPQKIAEDYAINYEQVKQIQEKLLFKGNELKKFV